MESELEGTYGRRDFIDRLIQLMNNGNEPRATRGSPPWSKKVAVTAKRGR